MRQTRASIRPDRVFEYQGGYKIVATKAGWVQKVNRDGKRLAGPSAAMAPAQLRCATISAPPDRQPSLEQFHIFYRPRPGCRQSQKRSTTPPAPNPERRVRGPLGLPSATALLFSPSSRGAQRGGRAKATEDRSFYSRLCAGGTLCAQRDRITDSMKSG
jgi:hypothetical protein